MRVRSAVVTFGFVLAIALAPAGLLAADDPPDSWLTTKAKITMLTSIGTAGSDVNVDTVGGIITLHGSVPTESDKDKAEDAVKDLDGVKEVRNLLQVVPPKKEAQIQAKDEEIENRVSAALKKDPELDDSSITVQSVSKGTVLLAGTADTLLDHLRAIEIAKNVKGVKKVASEIESPDEKADAEIWKHIESAGTETKSGAKKAKDAVAGSASSAARATKNAAVSVGGAARDAWITSATKARLLADDETPGSAINVDTENGVVTLFGTVESATAKKEAEAEAKKVAGVKRVDNRLKIESKATRGEDSAGMKVEEESD